MISDLNKKYLLSLKPEDLTFDVLVSLFGDTLNDKKNIQKSRFNTTDEMELLPGEYFVKEKTLTTVGRFIYNKYIIERLNLQNVLGYINYPITNSANGKIEAILSQALIEDKVSTDTFHQYIDYRDNLGMQLNSVITTSFTMNTIKTPPSVQRKKMELFKKHAKEIAEGNIVVSERIEKELVADAKAVLKGDPGMDLYSSEARGNFGNYKNMNLFKGATMNNITGKFDIVTSSFMDGIKKEDIPSFGTAVVSGAYPKAVGTQESGYLAKQLLAAMQSEVLDEHGTDCGSKKTISATITAKNKKDYVYRYIIENGKLVLLSPDVIDKYICKEVHLRTPMYCLGDKTCNKCAGEFNYILNNINIGLGCSKIATTLLRLGMKKFHTANIGSKQINVDDMLI